MRRIAGLFTIAVVVAAGLCAASAAHAAVAVPAACASYRVAEEEVGTMAGATALRDASNAAQPAAASDPKWTRVAGALDVLRDRHEEFVGGGAVAWR